MACAISLFCQDIREEKAGTVSIVGIFPDNISVAQVPFTFPKIAIYGRLSFLVTDEPPKEISLRLAQADNTEIPLSVFDAEIIQRARAESQAKGGAKAGLIATAILVSFPVKQAGRINVMVKIDGEESICGTLNVQVEGT
jgi:hypothetical protein